MDLPTPAPTTWADGVDKTKHAERCLGSYWSEDDLLPDLILGKIFTFILFVGLFMAFEHLLTRVKKGKEGRAMFLPPGLLISIFRYLFTQMIIQSALIVLAFYIFIAAGNLEVACYLQYYRPGDSFYGNVATPIVIGIIVYLHVLVNWIARPAVGRRYSRILADNFLDFAVDGVACDRGASPLRAVFVGSLDGFHPTKLAGFLQKSEAGPFMLTCLDAYGQIEISEDAVTRNASALGLSDVMTIAVAKRGVDGDLRMPRDLYATQHFAVIFGDYIADHPLLGLEYETNETVQDLRVEELLLELRYLLAPGARVVITSAKNKAGDKLSSRWGKLLATTGYKVEKKLVDPKSWFINRKTTLLVGTLLSQVEQQRQSVVLTVESERVLAEKRYFADKVFRVAVVSTFLVYMGLCAAVIVTFRNSKFPKEVGVYLYFNMFALNTMVQLPGGLVVGLYLLRVKFNRATLEMRESMVLAAQYLAASYFIGLLQSFFFGYLFSIIINYYVLFLCFGIPPSSNTAVLIDVAIFIVLGRIFTPREKPEEDLNITTGGEDTDGAGGIDLVVHTTTDLTKNAEQGEWKDNPIRTSAAAANEQQVNEENSVRTSSAALSGTYT